MTGHLHADASRICAVEGKGGEHILNSTDIYQALLKNPRGWWALLP